MGELFTDKEYFDKMFKAIDENFKAVNARLDRLNGSVARHEKVINENLPHNIAHCPQAEKIEDLEKNMITSEAVKKTLYVGFGVVCALIAAIWGITEMIK